jgi:hypothetical protein
MENEKVTPLTSRISASPPQKGQGKRICLRGAFIRSSPGDLLEDQHTDHPHRLVQIHLHQCIYGLVLFRIE